MITPDVAMRQAHETAREYAIYAKKAYEDLFDISSTKRLRKGDKKDLKINKLM